MKKKVLLTSVVTIILCLCLIAGSTYALFTTAYKTQIVVQSANLAVEAEPVQTSVAVWSLGQTAANAAPGHFANGGWVDVDPTTHKLTIYRMTPGDGVRLNILVTDHSNVAAQYRIRASKGTGVMAEALTMTVKIGNQQLTWDTNASGELCSQWFSVDELKDIISYDGGCEQFPIEVQVYFPNSKDNQNAYQNQTTELYFIVEAVQGNGVDGSDNLITTP